MEKYCIVIIIMIRVIQYFPNRPISHMRRMDSISLYSKVGSKEYHKVGRE